MGRTILDIRSYLHFSSNDEIFVFVICVQGTSAATVESIEEKMQQASFIATLDAISIIIDRISSEVLQFSDRVVRLHMAGDKSDICQIVSWL